MFWIRRVGSSCPSRVRDPARPRSPVGLQLNPSTHGHRQDPRRGQLRALPAPASGPPREQGRGVPRKPSPSLVAAPASPELGVRLAKGSVLPHRRPPLPGPKADPPRRSGERPLSFSAGRAEGKGGGAAITGRAVTPSVSRRAARRGRRGHGQTDTGRTTRTDRHGQTDTGRRTRTAGRDRSVQPLSPAISPAQGQKPDF